MAKRMVSKSFMFGALAGGIAGSVAALLLAPKSGRELRKDIAEGATQVSERTVHIASQVGETTTRIARQAGGGVSTAASGLIDTIRNWRAPRETDDNGSFETGAAEESAEEENKIINKTEEFQTIG